MRELAKVRISFRSTVARLRRLEAIAQKNDWLNAHGRPNLSAVLNHVIDMFDAKKKKERKS